MCVTICGKFRPDEGAVAGYGNRIRVKSPAKWGVQIAGMIFQTRSRSVRVYRKAGTSSFCECSVFVTAMFFINFHQNNIITNLADTIPGNDIFTALSEKTKAEASWSRNDQGSDTAVFTVEFHIHRTAKGAAGADIDDFFLL